MSDDKHKTMIIKDGKYAQPPRDLILFLKHDIPEDELQQLIFVFFHVMRQEKFTMMYVNSSIDSIEEPYVKIKTNKKLGDALKIVEKYFLHEYTVWEEEDEDEDEE